MDELNISFREAVQIEMDKQIERLGDAADVAETEFGKLQTRIENIIQLLSTGGEYRAVQVNHGRECFFADGERGAGVVVRELDVLGVHVLVSKDHVDRYVRSHGADDVNGQLVSSVLFGGGEVDTHGLVPLKIGR
jgi:hypothetical protein